MPQSEMVNVRYLVAEVAASYRVRRASTSTISTEVVAGPAGAQVLAIDPSGNLIELFQPAVTAK